MAPPETRFARTIDGSQIAYQAVGDGPLDLLVASPTFIPVDLMWDEPRAVQFLHRLSAFSRHLWFDYRGTGASDMRTPSDDRLIESWVEDMLAVADDAGVERLAVLQLGGLAQGALFAATHPERTAALVLVDTSARLRRAPDYPVGWTTDEIAQVLDTSRSWASVESVAPSLVGDDAFWRWYERAVRLGAPPDLIVRRYRAAAESDSRSVLGAVQAPTLVIARLGTRRVEQTRYMAEHIPGARLVEVDSAESLAFVDAAATLDAIEEFLTGTLTAPEPDRQLTTVMFTDLVSSTPQVQAMGDRRWRSVLATHDALVRAELDRFRGREVGFEGDGVLATFDGPGRAIRCACAIRDALAALDLDVRAGLHTGEVEVRGDDIAGIAVHVGQRISARAGPRQVLVSRTVADLVAGSDIELHDEGEHELKGISGTTHLFSVVRA